MVFPFSALRCSGDTQKRQEALTDMLSWKRMKATEKACRNLGENEEAAAHDHHLLPLPLICNAE